ncbi:hypothetical protein scyTo_0005619 [Scyliorhinus torazame]|uniref:Uncharacterized protein n=1 Tax=Scyliorhinus torazame TaxID=75743 RepID=A0A401PAP0_SCYTO|nr:hypothetical protein [Scyliorhinus torazame]
MQSHIDNRHGGNEVGGVIEEEGLRGGGLKRRHICKANRGKGGVRSLDGEEKGHQPTEGKKQLNDDEPLQQGSGESDEAGRCRESWVNS